jgi:tetratricopeptide (TPR) repeat protein
MALRFTLGILLLAVRSGLAGDEPNKGWHDWLTEGQALRSAGNYSAAAQALRQALRLSTKVNVSRGELIQMHDALASICADGGHFAESEGEYRLTLSLIETAEGQGSLDYAVVLASLSVLPTQTGKHEEEIAIMRKAIADHAKDSTDKLAIVRGCLALILKNQNRYEEEETLLIEAIHDLAKAKTPEPQMMGGFLNDLAVLRLDQGRYEEAIGLQQESIGVLETALGKEHPSLVVPFNNLAMTLVKLSRFAEASVTYQHAIEVCRKTLGEDHFDYGVLLQNYGFVLRKLGRKHEARQAETEGQQIERAVNRRNGVGLRIGVSALRSEAALR